MTASDWPDRRILDLFAIDVPIIQAPMANSSTPEMALAVCQAGGLGSLPCAAYTADQAREALALIRRGTDRPVNLNFFCHHPPPDDPARLMNWRARLAPACFTRSSRAASGKPKWKLTTCGRACSTRAQNASSKGARPPSGGGAAGSRPSSTE